MAKPPWMEELRRTQDRRSTIDVKPAPPPVASKPVLMRSAPAAAAPTPSPPPPSSKTPPNRPAMTPIAKVAKTPAPVLPSTGPIGPVTNKWDLRRFFFGWTYSKLWGTDNVRPASVVFTHLFEVRSTSPHSLTQSPWCNHLRHRGFDYVVPTCCGIYRVISRSRRFFGFLVIPHFPGLFVIF